MVTFVDPRGVPATPVESYDLSVDPTAPGRRVGLLANGFPDSVRFLRAVERALAARLPDAEFELFDKRDPTTVVSDVLRDQIDQHCDMVAAAYGH